MAQALMDMYTAYNNFLDENHDPRTKHLPLMGGPVAIILLIASYMYFISVLGPKLMKNRKPMDLKWLMHLYNAIQVVANSWLAYVVLTEILIPKKYNFWCDGIEPTEDPFGIWIVKICYFYFLLKVFDFVDTIIMVLRKKDGQASFLHKYHHVIICVAGWVGTAFVPGGPQESLFGVMNCSIHAVMYSYYSATIIKPELRHCKYKRHLTEIQIAQFVISGIHATVGYFYPNCTFPKWALLLFIPQDIFMICMFLDFYIKAYIKPKQMKKQQHTE